MTIRARSHIEDAITVRHTAFDHVIKKRLKPDEILVA